MIFPILLCLFLIATAVIGLKAWSKVRARGLDRWVPSYVFPTEPKPHVSIENDPIDLFIAVCDHYEPEWGNPDIATALARVQRWHDDYPRFLGQFTDVDGRPPRHSFFFPQDQYRPEYLDVVASLCNQGYGEVDIHLHHHDDTPEGLEEKLDSFRQALFHQHGMLRRDPITNEIVYGAASIMKFQSC